MMRHILTVRCCTGMLIATLLFGISPAAVAGSVALGRMVAEAYCSPCHAVGPTGRSPHAPAPPFRTLHQKYNVETFAEKFANGIIVGHPGPRRMPQLQLSPADMDDLIAYLKSLEPSRPVRASQREGQSALRPKPR